MKNKIIHQIQSPYMIAISQQKNKMSKKYYFFK